MITAEQKLQRANRIGSSDAAAILGLDPYRSAADVWLEKTGRAEGFAGNENTERGNLLEPALLGWAAKELDKCILSGDSFEHPSGLLVANLDGYMMGEPSEVQEIVEAKTTVNRDEWGEEGTDQVPERVAVQVHHQFVCVPTARICWVPVLMPGFRSFDFKLYRVERNDDLCTMVEKSGLEFMEKFVLPAIQPDDFRPSLEVLKRVRREPNKIVPVADELVANRIAAHEEKRLILDKCEKADISLLAAMADAEGATWSGGTVTYLETHRKAYEVKESSYRTLRIKANKTNGAKP